MRTGPLQRYLFAILSAALLELPFPLAGPLPYWRTFFAWIGLAPLLYMLLRLCEVAHPKYLRRSFVLAYLTGILWYLGNCYWIYATMHVYGGLAPVTAILILLGFCLVLGLYFGFFGLGVALLRKGFGSTKWALAGAPVLWVALEFAASRITSVPWDQLGYSQVDNYFLTHLAPFTGVYGISAVLVAANAVLVWVWLMPLTCKNERRLRWGKTLGWLLVIVGLMLGHGLRPAAAPTQATAVLVQPNLSVNVKNDWEGVVWDSNIAELTRLSLHACGDTIGGIPETNAPGFRIDCSEPTPRPDLIAWPESPSPFQAGDPRFQQVMRALAHASNAMVIAGNQAADLEDGVYKGYNSASVYGPDGRSLGRYDKIHLVPFGEYTPYKELLFFAGHLTQNVSDFSRGTERKVFVSHGHRYGVFICYESVFADEVRHFAANGAEVFVNISDDAWYGDTSAPWQHLNMARMRAIENRRWILRDTNDGVTSVIDPYGRVLLSTPRHQRNSLLAHFGFRDDVTFYSRFGDAFAMLCTLVSLAAVISGGKRISRAYRQRFQVKVSN